MTFPFSLLPSITWARADLNAFAGDLKFDLVIFVIAAIVAGVVTKQIKITHLVGDLRKG